MPAWFAPLRILPPGGWAAQGEDGGGDRPAAAVAGHPLPGSSIRTVLTDGAKGRIRRAVRTVGGSGRRLRPCLWKSPAPYPAKDAAGPVDFGMRTRDRVIPFTSTGAGPEGRSAAGIRDDGRRGGASAVTGARRRFHGQG